MQSVIVFGPTGRIGAVAARTAGEHGVKVWLAMRDTSKAITDLSVEKERPDQFERIQADLTKPDSLATAVRTSGAKRAFIYRAHGTSDHMKSSLDALRSAGIELVVFLSSFTVNREPKDIPESEVIPYLHAQVEINLADIFGQGNYVAVRPGVFATNLLRYKEGIKAGYVSIPGTRWEMDAVAHDDIGKISGTILAQGARNGQYIVYVYGPQVIEQGQAIVKVGEVLGRKVELKELDAQVALDQFIKMGVPQQMAEYMVRISSRSSREASDHRVQYEQGVRSLEEYTGQRATKLEEWAEANKALFNE